MSKPINIYSITPLVIDIDAETKKNINYRRVIHTGVYSQTVLMSIGPHSEIGHKIHPDNDLSMKIESGTGYAQIDNTYYPLKPGIWLDIPAGTYHNIVNESNEDLKTYIVYSPPFH